MATPISAQGTTFTFNDGSNAQTVGGVTSFSFGDGEASDINVSTLASTAQEFRQGLQDNGNLSVDLIVDPADVGQAAMRNAKTAQAIRQCIWTFPGGYSATFNAYVKSVPTAGSVDAVLTGSASLKVTGDITWVTP